MGEVMFVIKGLVIALLITIAMQFKIGGETLEVKSDRLLHHTSIGNFLNQTAQGGALLIKRGTAEIQKLAGVSFGKSESPRKSSEAKWEAPIRRHSPPQPATEQEIDQTAE